MTKATFAGLVLAVVSMLQQAAAETAGVRPPVDYRSLVSRADITYDKPVTRSEEGLPVGNGRMGSLVWTTPAALKFQINRVDVLPVSGSTHSFPERHTDTIAGCGYVDINFADFGDDVFTTGSFRQQLAVYDGLMTARGRGVTARVLAWPARDVLAVEIDDNRPQPSPVNIDLRMLRYLTQYFPRLNYELAKNHTVLVQHRNHTAASRLDLRDGRILLTQEFREGKYYNASAVAIGVLGRESKARYLNETTVRLSAAPGKGKFVVLIAGAASFKPNDDAAAPALKELDAAAARGFDRLLSDNLAWWHDFWSKGFVRLHSADGEADFVEQNYTYFLYLMAASSRRAYPPRFGGMLWLTNGDMLEWGSQFWWHNLGCYYDGLLAANRLELVDPVFAMYSGMYEAATRAARQQWGSQGIFIPETGFFDGLEDLPEEIAAELRDLYLGRKPWEQRSANFMRYAETKNPHNSRWNWIDKSSWVDGHWDIRDRGKGPRGPVVHILSSGAKIAHLYWQRYQYAQDKAWLRDRAYPMLKGIAEFYRNYPNVKKGADGKYHIHDVNNHEPVWGATDAQEEIAAMRGILPVAIRASEILGVDAELRAAWRDFLAKLAPLPTNEKGLWVGARPPVVNGEPNRLGLLPVVYYDLCAVGTEDARTLKTGNATYDASLRSPVDAKTPVSVLSQIAAAAAHLGRGNDLKYMLPNQIRCLAPDRDFCDYTGSGKAGVLANRLTLREGPGAIDAERLGRITRGLHEGLLQSLPPAPGKDPVIRVFPAWPKEWDAEFSLLARGAFVVSAALREGRIAFVEIRSQRGGECRLRNPWPDRPLTLYRNGKQAENLSGALPVFPTAQNETIMLVPRGSTPPAKRASP